MDAGFNLHQRVALISGPLSSTVSSIVMGLTRLGADCVILDPDKSVPQAFINQINDSREINDKFGRAAVLPSDLTSRDQIKDLIGRASQTFGGLDIYIDALMINQPTPMKIDDPIDGLDLMFDKHLKSSLYLTQGVLAFFKNRKRGRILYLLNDSPSVKAKEDVIVQAVRSGLKGFAASLAKQVSEFNITANALSIALTEEYILAHEPGTKSIKEALEKMKQLDPALRITEPDKIMQTVIFLVSPLGISINGQTLNLS
ncbi:SDR family NAD(P)-dependent oxidoreductase [Bdellovibrio sp. HCB337]|uniref:SDR family NAD(P)-dependent oxidoreductase n=1 Tax=Bdellovibrio sp. HCB337 TaxID=3394358 RepID=UPI0039A54327